MIPHFSKYYILILIIGLFTTKLEAEPSKGFLYSLETLDTKDTLVLKRYLGEWWIGARAGVAGTLFFGTVNSTRLPNENDNPFNSPISFKGGLGVGSYLGIMGEYLPQNEDYGIVVDIGLLNGINGDVKTNELDTMFNTKYDFEGSITYLSISPGMRYNFGIEGLHAFGMLNFMLPIGSEFKQRREFENPSYIEQFVKIQNYPASFRVGLQLGVGYDIFNADFRNKYRLRLEPFTSIAFGTPFLTQMSSSWNGIVVRAGLSIKIGPDIIEYDTLKFDPTYVAPRLAAIQTRSAKSISFDFKLKRPIIASANLNMVSNPKILGEVSQSLVLKETEKPLVSVTQPQTPERNIEIETDKLARFSFASANSAQLTQELQDYLEATIDYLTKNPKAKLQITGYSDNTGSTIDQNTERSRLRAEAVRRYLINRNIPASRLFVDYKGSLNPYRSNDTPQGRKSNNRVEIVVLK